MCLGPELYVGMEYQGPGWRPVSLQPMELTRFIAAGGRILLYTIPNMGDLLTRLTAYSVKAGRLEVTNVELLNEWKNRQI